MAGIVVCGGGAGGLITGMLLAGDGHEVVVLERDPAPPPAPADAWEAWERRGVNQFRLPHMLLARFRELCDAELPAVTEGLRRAGARAFNPLGDARDLVPGGDRLDVLTARRPVAEAVIAAVAAETKGLEVRRGVAVEGMATGPSAIAGVPHVTGVRTATGEELAADLVVAATGRRSPLDRWLADLGAVAPLREEMESGLAYYGCHVRLPDGAPFLPPGIVDCGSIGLLVLPGDGGTYGIGIIGLASDAALRPLRDRARWEQVVRALPDGGLLVDEATPISDNVVMAGIEDQWSRFVVDGVPVATGVVAVGDAWAATNPSLGRGITMAAMHAVALRDLVRHVDLGDAPGLVRAFDEATERDFTPWFRSTTWQDHHRLGLMRDRAEGREPATGADPLWDDLMRLERLQAEDPMLGARGAFSALSLTERPEEILADPAVRSRLEGLDCRPTAPVGPSRRELLELIG